MSDFFYYENNIRELSRQLQAAKAALEASAAQGERDQARIKELEHLLKVEREEVKKFRQRHGAGRWM